MDVVCLVVTEINLLGATATMATMATQPIMLQDLPHPPELGLLQVCTS